MFSVAGCRSCCKYLLFVCLSVPLLWICMHEPALGEERTQGFHQRAKRVSDPRRPKKCSIIKRFNCVWIFAFPPGGANLLWCSQKIILLKDKRNLNKITFAFKNLVLPQSKGSLIWLLPYLSFIEKCVDLYNFLNVDYSFKLSMEFWDSTTAFCFILSRKKLWQLGKSGSMFTILIVSYSLWMK